MLECRGPSLRYLGHGCIVTSKSEETGRRLLTIFAAISDLIDQWGPDAAAMESLYFWKNVSSALPVAEAKGVIRLAFARACLPLVEYSPTAIKQAVSGSARSEKGQVQELVGFCLVSKKRPDRITRQTPWPLPSAEPTTEARLKNCGHEAPLNDRLARGAGPPITLMKRVRGAYMEVNPASKADIRSIAEKNKIAMRIAQALSEREGFLLIGHRNPDEDCVAAMVSFGLLASRLNKAAYIYLCGDVHEQFSYLLNICTYNSIVVLRDDDPLRAIQAIVALDTPKSRCSRRGTSCGESIADPGVLKIEIDHHLGSDSNYFGDDGYRLVAAASSASELVGYLGLKMDEIADSDWARVPAAFLRVISSSAVLPAS